MALLTLPPLAREPQVHVVALRALHEIDDVRTAWERLYAADPGATVFASWAWYRAYMESARREPLVLAASDAADGSYVAFLPLELVRGRVARIVPIGRLTIAGDPIADYAGMIAACEHQAAASTAFARYIADGLRWDEFRLCNVDDERLVDTIAQLPRTRFLVADDGTTRCPYISLPDDFEAFVAGLGPRARASLRRGMRKLSSLPGFRFELMTDATATRTLNALLDLHEQRFPMSADRRAMLEALFCRTFAAGVLRVYSLWCGEKPIAGLAAFVDRKSGTILSYLGGFDPEYRAMAPGRTCFAYAIRDAIESGFTTFDFTRGDEEYKYELGAQDRTIRHFTVTRLDAKRTALRLASRAGRRVLHLVAVARNAYRYGVVQRLYRSSNANVYRARLVARDDVEDDRTIAIRTLAADDVARCTGEQLSALELSTELCARQWANGDLALGAFVGPALLGVVWASRRPTPAPEAGAVVRVPPGAAYVYHCSVSPLAKGKGIAPAMLRALARELRGLDIDEVWYVITTRNAASRRAFGKVADVRNEYAVSYVKTPFGARHRLAPDDGALRGFLSLAPDASPPNPA